MDGVGDGEHGKRNIEWKSRTNEGIKRAHEKAKKEKVNEEEWMNFADKNICKKRNEWIRERWQNEWNESENGRTIFRYFQEVDGDIKN